MRYKTATSDFFLYTLLRVYYFKVKLNTNKTSLTTCHESNSVNKYFIDVCFPGKARVKLENKGDLSFFAKQDEAVSITLFLS